jgi:hypothetical protein
VDQAFEHLAVLIDGTPPVGALAIDGQNALIEVPCSAQLWSTAPQRRGRVLAKLAAPLAEGLVGHDYTPDEQEFLPIAGAEVEAGVQPAALAENFGGQAVVLLAVGGRGMPATSMPHQAPTGQVALTKWTMPSNAPYPNCLFLIILFIFDHTLKYLIRQSVFDIIAASLP